MLKRLKTYLTYGNRFCGVECSAKEGEEVAYVTCIKKSKQQVELEGKHQEVIQNKVFAKLNKNTPVVLIINNDQVLSKTVPNDSDDARKKIDRAFPNIDLEDFYYELIDQATMSFVSICRKEYVGQLIKEFAERKIPVVNVAMGHGLCSTLGKYLDNRGVQSSNANLSFEGKSISKIDVVTNPSIQEQNINGIEISSTGLLSFCGALLLIQDNYHPTSNLNHLKEQLQSSYVQKRWYKLGSKVALLSLFGILLINFVIFNHYFNQVNRLKENALVNETTKQRMLVLNEEVNKLQKKVDNMFRNGSSKSSWFIVQIAQSLPESVMLSNLNFQPLSKKVRPNQPILVENNILVISGESSNGDQFSEWMAKLEAMQWIEKVEITNYQDMSKERSGFQIKLIMTND